MLDASAQVCLIFPGGNLDFQTLNNLFQTSNFFKVFFKEDSDFPSHLFKRPSAADIWFHSQIMY